MTHSSQQSIAETVVSTVADVKGVDATELERPLYEVVRSDSLNTLFGDTTGELTFEYLDTTVTVNADGEVSVKPIEAPHP